MPCLVPTNVALKLLLTTVPGNVESPRMRLTIVPAAPSIASEAFDDICAIVTWMAELAVPAVQLLKLQLFVPSVTITVYVPAKSMGVLLPHESANARSARRIGLM